MGAYSIRYKFGQRFAVPAEDAYLWCTDYRPDDYSLMGIKGERRIRHISKNVIVLNDRTERDGRYIPKRRLVLLYPERLSWTNTHLAGPNKHSQFIYEIAPEGKGSSRLDFTGFQINYDDGDATPAAIAALADRLRKDDSSVWALLAQAMEKDLKKSTKRVGR